MPDLWPDDIGFTQVKAPVTILMEQASLLGVKTQNLVTASIDRDRYPIPRDKNREFSYTFSLVAPALQHYRYNLFELFHGIGLYPLFLKVDEAVGGSDALLAADNEEQFLDILGRIFNASKTRQIIQSMLVQSRAFERPQRTFTTRATISSNYQEGVTEENAEDELLSEEVDETDVDRT